MDNGSTNEQAKGHGAAGLDGVSAGPLTVAVDGYCAACGTWDKHGLTCNACGYDFTGGQTADARN